MLVDIEHCGVVTGFPIILTGFTWFPRCIKVHIRRFFRCYLHHFWGRKELSFLLMQTLPQRKFATICLLASPCLSSCLSQHVTSRESLNGFSWKFSLIFFFFPVHVCAITASGVPGGTFVSMKRFSALCGWLGQRQGWRGKFSLIFVDKLQFWSKSDNSNVHFS
jgi:hypothetical protein